MPRRRVARKRAFLTESRAMNGGSGRARVALVTGASKGVGRGIALELARGGYCVGVNYHTDADGAARTVAEIETAGGEALAVAGNVSVARDVANMVNAVTTRWHALDLLVNNAGVQTWKPFLDLTEAE